MEVRMGTWGPANFSSDSALDWLGEFVAALVAEISEGIADRYPSTVCDHPLAAKIEVLTLLCEQSHAVPPEPEEVAAWREAYLQRWEAHIDSYDPNPEYRAKRREVLDSTFARLAAVADRWHRSDSAKARE
jgi:hypothetical protein